MVSDLERAAMNGVPPPDGLDLVRLLYYQNLSLLYRRFRLGQITREEGSVQKKQMEYQRDLLDRRVMTKERVSAAAAKQLRDVEYAANRYAKERSLEHADGMYQAIYGIGL